MLIALIKEYTYKKTKEKRVKSVSWKANRLRLLGDLHTTFRPPEPAITISFMKKERFWPKINGGDRVFMSNNNCMLTHTCWKCYEPPPIRFE